MSDKWTIAPAVLSAVAITLSAAGAAASAPSRAPSANRIRDDPITISASNLGRFAAGRSWYLSVNSAGQAELTVATLPKRVHRRFQVPEDALASLRETLIKMRFFELGGPYGQIVPDGSTQTLTITCGARTKTVSIHFLMNWRNDRDKHKLREPARALRVWMLIRGWFDDAEAVNLGRYQRMVLETVAETPEPEPHPRRAAEEKAISIAKALAKKQGYRLEDYLEPKVTFNAKKRRWEVSFEHTPPQPPGGHFDVWIDDRTGNARLMPGQ